MDTLVIANEANEMCHVYAACLLHGFMLMFPYGTIIHSCLH
jgi:hypothetical protein